MAGRPLCFIPETSGALVMGDVVEHPRRARSGPIPLWGSWRSREAGRDRFESGADRVGLAAVPRREGQKVVDNPWVRFSQEAERDPQSLRDRFAPSGRSRSRRGRCRARGRSRSAGGWVSAGAPATAWISVGGFALPVPSQRERDRIAKCDCSPELPTTTRIGGSWSSRTNQFCRSASLPAPISLSGRNSIARSDSPGTTM